MLHAKDGGKMLTERENVYWLAPEVIKADEYSKASDVWSLGCCIIEMLTTKPPWTEHGPNNEKVRKVIEQTRKPPKYPQGLSD